MIRKRVILLLSLAAVSVAAHAGDCTVAQQHYEKGVAAGKLNDWEAAKQWFGKSVAQCNQFQNWYRLGQTELELKNYPQAASAFEDARRYAKDDEQRALAVARYAEVRGLEGETYQALTLIHEARRMHPNPPQWMTDLARKLDEKRINEPLTVAQVTRALNNRSVKLLNLDAKPNINISINFVSNSVEPIDQSKKSIEVLAQALADKSLEGKQIVLFGHADERGGDNYNADLSKNRAEHIAQELISRQPSLQGHLTTAGKGEKEPLYKGKTEQDYLFNRRIEVQVE